jgi:hypothetical protein
MNMTNIDIHHSKFKETSCNLLLLYLNKSNHIPFIKLQPFTVYKNKQLEHGCTYSFPSTTRENHIQTIWSEIKLHVPYLTNAQLYIPGKYEGDIISYTKNTGLIEDALQTVKDQPWILS